MTDDGPDFAELERRARTRKDYVATKDGATDKSGSFKARLAEFPLECYLHHLTISQQQYDCGCRFRALYDTGSAAMAAQPYDGTPAPTSYTSKTHPAHVLDAWAEYSRILKKLGIRISTPLIVICCYGEGIQVAYRVKRQTRAYTRAVGQFQLALDELGDALTGRHPCG